MSLLPPARAGPRIPTGLDQPHSASRALLVTVAVSSLAIIVVGALAFTHGAVQWPELPGFVWGHVMAFLIVDVITCVLLTRYVLVTPSRSIAVLSAAYLFSAIVAVTFFLSFPGTLDDGPLLGGSQSSIVQYYLWHIGFMALVLISSLLVGAETTREPPSLRWVTGSLLAGAALAAAVAGIAIGRADALPILITTDPDQPLTTWFYGTSWVTLAVCLLTLAASVWAARHGSRLRIWLVLVAVLVTVDVVTQMSAGGRYSVGWYVPRGIGVIATSVLLVLLVAEVMRHSQQLARSLDRQDEMWQLIQHARDGFLVVGHGGHVLWANDRAGQLFGYPDRDMPASLDELLPGVATDGRRRRAAAATIDSGSVATLRMDALRSDGTRIPVEIGLRRIPTRSGALLAVSVVDLTREVTTARELANARQEQARLAAAVEQSPLGYFAATTGLILSDVNPGMTPLTGYDRSELVGQSLTRLLAPEAAPSFRELVAGLLAGGARRVSTRARFRRRDGSLLWVDVLVHALVGDDGSIVGVAGTLSDVTAEVAAEAAEQAPIGIAATDRDGRLTHVNAAFCRIAGRDRADLLGRPVTGLLRPGDRAADAEQLAALIHGDSRATSLQCRFHRPDGSEIWTDIHRAVLRDETGRITGLTMQVVDITAQKDAEAAVRSAMADLDYRSSHDLLTGLLNRSAFHREVTDVVRRSPGAIAVLFVDVDRFKQINDALSHAHGDTVLQQVARIIRECVRSDDVVARLGGDEFAVAVAGLAEPEDAYRVAESIVAAVSSRELGTTTHPLHVTVSVGVAVSSGDTPPETLVQQADVAMYRAKQAGRGRWRAFDSAMMDDLVSRMTLSGQLREAVAAGEFRAWYQPIRDLRTGELVGYEALARWVAPGCPVREAAGFMAVAEETGLVVDIGGAILDDAVAALSRLPRPMTMSVNVSPAQLLAEDVAHRVSRALDRGTADPSRLVLELTEQSLLIPGPGIARDLARITDLGVALHVDDFGAGFSSMTQLRDFPVSGVKLDASFTAAISGGDVRAAELAGGLADLAARLGMQRTAEAIETPQQRATLADLGWSRGQGWLLGRPAAVALADAQPTAPASGVTDR